MAERSKARVCSRSPVGIAGSNPAEGMGVCVCVLYSKDKRHSQDNQDKVVVQMKYRERNTIPGQSMWDFFLCVRQVCYLVLRILPARITPPMLHIHSSITDATEA